MSGRNRGQSPQDNEQRSLDATRDLRDRMLQENPGYARELETQQRRQTPPSGPSEQDRRSLDELIQGVNPPRSITNQDRQQLQQKLEDLGVPRVPDCRPGRDPGCREA